MELREVWRALRVSWWLPVVATVLGGSLALVISLVREPSYTSHTQLFVSTTDSATTADFFQGSQFSQQRVTSYAQLIAGRQIAALVIGRLGMSQSPEELAGQVEAVVVPDTVLINVSVTDRSPEQARLLAAEIGEEFSRYVTELETPEGGGASPVKVTVTEQPETPVDQSSPQTARDVVLGGLVGLLVGSGLAIARVHLDRSVRGAAEVSSLAGAPLIGLVVRDDSLQTKHTVDRNSSSRTAEAFRQLRTNLQFLNVDEPPKVIMITSAVPAEGKTTVAINLALTLADSGRSVVLVEGDLRRPRVTRYLGLVGGAGLTNVLAGSADVADVLQLHASGDLQVLAAGPNPPNPSELLASSNMFKLIDDLRGENDFVLIDAPPLLPVADATGLAVLVDGVVLSVRYGKTRKDQLQQARASLDRVGARTLGVVLNFVPLKAEVTSAYGYSDSYSYDSERLSRGQ